MKIIQGNQNAQGPQKVLKIEQKAETNGNNAENKDVFSRIIKNKVPIEE